MVNYVSHSVPARVESNLNKFFDPIYIEYRFEGYRYDPLRVYPRILPPDPFKTLFHEVEFRTPFRLLFV